MNIKSLLTPIIAALVFSTPVFLVYGKWRSLGEQPYLTLVPLPSMATLDNGHGWIPFKVTNNYAKDIAILRPYDVISLTTLTNSGQKVPVDQFREGAAYSHVFSGPKTATIVLKPGETGTFAGSFFMDTLLFVAHANKKMMGHMTGYIEGTNESFESYSAPFSVPANLATPPGLILERRDFFSVTPNLKKLSTESGVTDGLLISIPVEIKNVSRQAYIVDRNLAVFYLERRGWPKERRLGWDTIKAPGQLLRPGESIESTRRSYTTTTFLANDGYKPGDKLIAVVGGRIPDTNQIFQCYSAPFELPPLPGISPAK